MTDIHPLTHYVRIKQNFRLSVFFYKAENFMHEDTHIVIPFIQELFS